MLKPVFLLKLIAATSLASILFNPAKAQRIAPFAYSSSAPVNYVRTWEAKAPQTDPNKILVGASTDSFLMATQYIDGLGRPIQTVARQASPMGKDLVTPIVYDEFGREQFSYLPFVANTTGGNSSITDGLFKLNPFQQDSTFNKSMFGAQGETYFYSQTQFEASPLNRPTKTLAPGDSWIGAGRGVEQQYLVNTTSDSVRIWIASATVSTAPTTTATYAAGELYKNVTTDEGGKSVVEYKDKEGKVVLKKVQLAPMPGGAHIGWLCTYYVYDDLGNLRYVLPPKAVQELLLAGSWTISSTQRDELCFYYGYDSRNRMILKKVPGAGQVFMVYDARDRVVMTQDSIMRIGTEKWLVTLYDELNRPVETGLVNNSSISNKTFATHLSDASGSTAYPFAITSIPSSGWEELTQSGYDDYTNLPSGCPSGSIDNTYTTGTNFFTTYNAYPDYAQDPTAQSQQTRGLPTWTKVKVLDPSSSSSTFLYSVTIYDEKGHVIQVKSTNITGGTDIATTQYDFSGNVLRTLIAHQKSGTNAHSYYVLSKMTYDATGRLLATTKRVNMDGSSNTTDKTIVQNTYNELGQLEKNKLAPEYNSNSGLDSLEYDYNIRGWILGANRDYAKSTSSTMHYFGFDLGYDKTTIASLGSYANPAQYNGNINGIVWKSKGDGEVRKYDFTYDAVNRLTGADFNQYTGGFNKTADIDFTVKNLSYDANGNILTMEQRGWKVGGSQTIDSLLYTYQGSSNKLLSVLDRANDTATRLGDFRSSTLYMNNLGTKTTAATDYTYDGNGSLVKDLNKDIVTHTGANGIEYNYLSLPQKITVNSIGGDKGTIEYTYDATGSKLQKKTTEGSKVTTTLYLFGNYINDTLQFLPQEEGRIRPTTDVNNPFVYDYFLKDHLGNVRMVLTEEQKQDAYPPASMETANSTSENALYSNIDATRDDFPPNYPTNDTYTNPNVKVAKTNGNGNKIGPAIILKVMAGDKFNLMVSDWYKTSGATPGTPVNPLTDIVTALASGVAGASGGKVVGTELSSSGVLSLGVSSFLNNEGSSYATSKPKAFVNWVLFDEQFQYVSSSSGFEQVGGDYGTSVTPHTRSNMPIDKNGYLYVYVSNETPNIDVFFDNLQVTHIHGPMLEETHYYPFGLTMAGISSKAAGGIENNKQKFQGQEFAHHEFIDGSGLEMYEFKYRMDDPQIGRFWQIDPLASKYVYNSTYAFSENKVTGHVELEGLESVDIHMYSYMGYKQTTTNPTQSYNQWSQGLNNGATKGAPYNLNIITDMLPGVNFLKWGYQLYTGRDFFTREKLSGAQKVLMVIPMIGEFRGVSSVWRMSNALERGLLIEKALGGNLPKNFPVIDKLVDGVATSIKSVDLTAKSYNNGNGLLNTLKGYVNKLDNFTTATREYVTATEGVDFTSKALDVAIEPGKATLKQWEQIGEAMKYAKDKGIGFNLQFVK